MGHGSKGHIDLSLEEPASCAEPEHVQLPVNFITIGEVDNDDLKLYIRQDTFFRLEKYSAEDKSHERGSILIGTYSESTGKQNVIISEFIEAKYTDASASTLTFTHDTWDYIHKEHESQYPSMRIIGWQHTHPSYGIFLSNYDMFIQENFFNMPFQVAYVIDPLQNIRGFFQWKNGKVEKLNGYYIYDEVGKSIKGPVIDQAISKKSNISKAQFVWTCIGFVVVFGILIVVMRANSIRELTELNQNIAQAATIEQQSSQAQNDIPASVPMSADTAGTEALQELLIENAIAFGDTNAIREMIGQIQSDQFIISNKEEVLTRLNRRLETLEAKMAFKPQSIQGGNYTLFSRKVGYVSFHSTSLITDLEPRVWIISPAEDNTFTISSYANASYSWVIFGNVIEKDAKVELSKARYNAPAIWQLLANENGDAYLSPAGHPEMYLAYQNGFFLAYLDTALEENGEYPLLPISFRLVE